MATGLENLKIYQMSKYLELKVHEITKDFPRDELYRSVDQLRRSSSSVSNNIAEAYNKNSIKQKCQILRDIAISEAEETESNLRRCGDKDLLNKETAGTIADGYIELKKAIYGYIRFLNRAQLVN
ncbi:MAG: four helix bundle protein [Candidatus Sungbacteria bacterium]|uniref:Four helix bundle protein n=1 Tax=Candidatus Sungiibacteriota bacterium TaxID=2750080 RepID=A0A9D6LMC9_9BACT|nr:four helix bundle protein [Candidatus Sungbacteria bacterium]